MTVTEPPRGIKVSVSPFVSISKKVLIAILTLIILIINTNFAFAVEFISPGIEFETPQFFDAASSTLDLSVYFNTDEFVDYMVEQLKVVDGTSSTIAIIDITFTIVFIITDISSINLYLIKSTGLINIFAISPFFTISDILL